MPLRYQSQYKRPPTRIPRRPLREQLPLLLDLSGSGKRTRLATRRRRRRLMAGVVLATFLGLSVWGVGFLSYHERVTIKEISIAGAEALSPESLREAFSAQVFDGTRRLFSRANIFLYPRSSIEEGLLNEFPRLKSVSIARASLLSQAIVVTVREREERFYWCKEGSCYLMDFDGFIFAPLDEEKKDRYVFRGGLLPREPIEQTFLRGRLAGVVALLDALKGVGITSEGATVENEKDFSVTLTEGFFLKVGFDFDQQRVVRNIDLVLTSEAIQSRADQLEYIDLRFGNRVYYKFRGAEVEERE